jgi:hypothetical protein
MVHELLHLKVCAQEILPEGIHESVRATMKRRQTLRGRVVGCSSKCWFGFLCIQIAVPILIWYSSERDIARWCDAWSSLGNYVCLLGLIELVVFIIPVWSYFSVDHSSQFCNFQHPQFILPLQRFIRSWFLYYSERFHQWSQPMATTSRLPPGGSDCDSIETHNYFLGALNLFVVPSGPTTGKRLPWNFFSTCHGSIPTI